MELCNRPEQLKLGKVGLSAKSMCHKETDHSADDYVARESSDEYHKWEYCKKREPRSVSIVYVANEDGS